MPATSTSWPSISLEPGIHNVSYKVRSRKPVNANLFTIPSGTKVGVISDVDDTIMVTQAPRLMKAAYNLLLLNPRKKVPVASMNLLFNRIADMFPDAPFFYLSTSPWNVESWIPPFHYEPRFSGRAAAAARP